MASSKVNIPTHRSTSEDSKNSALSVRSEFAAQGDHPLRIGILRVSYLNGKWQVGSTKLGIDLPKAHFCVCGYLPTFAVVQEVPILQFFLDGCRCSRC
jgi:hypothetical protein